MKFMDLSGAWQEAFAPFLMSWFRDRETLTHKLLVGELEFYAAQLPSALTPFELSEKLLHIIHEREGQPPPLIQVIENSRIVAQYERANNRDVGRLRRLLDVATQYCQIQGLTSAPQTGTLTPPSTNPVPRLFLSYRRSDSGDMAGRIYDHLQQAFGTANVDKDTEAISAGHDWRGWIREQVVRCNSLLVLIGANWLSAQDAQGLRRLDDPGDWVRFEIQCGLEIPRIRVIPVLLGQTAMPAAALLPKVLQPLVYRQAARVRPDPDFAVDMERLIASLRT